MNDHETIQGSVKHLDRRAFLASATALTLATPFGAQTLQPPADGLIERRRDPLNLEFPFHTLDAAIVPNDRFFVRNHFP